MIRRILVPTDRSVFADHALPWALLLARRAKAKIDLVQVHVPAAVFASGAEVMGEMQLDGFIRENEASSLDELAKRLTSDYSIPVSSSLIDGAVGDAVLERAIAERTDLIIMTTHGRGPFSRFWLGSVADQLIRRARMPVLLVRPTASAPDLNAQPKVRRIVIPLDGSPLAEQALEPAQTLGELFGAGYTLMRAVEPMFSADLPVPGPGLGIRDPALLARFTADARSYLEQVAARLRERSKDVRTEVVLNRLAASAVLEETPAEDLIALATHGRGGMSRLVLGSVADKVVRGAAGPVLVYRPMANTRKGTP
jgi:nucleotide-binding universal stress UspA family protein